MNGAVVPMLVGLAIVACGGAAPNASAPAVSGPVVVFAAASLSEAFDALSAEFTARHPAVSVRRNYAGSSTLAAQIAQGAEVDVFAAADESNLRKLVDANLIEGTPIVFARNRLQIVVPAGNPRHIAQLSDLARPDLIVVLGAPAVPVGTYAAAAFAKAGVTVTPRSLEADVKSVLGKVSLGEADAGIVYRTDVKAGGARVEGVDIADPYNVTATYPIALARGARNPAAAAAFLAFVASERGRDVLTSFGFTPP